MSVYVQHNNTLLTVDYETGMTASSLLQKITDELGWRYHNTPQLQDTNEASVDPIAMSPNTPIVDGRYYNLLAWVREVVK